MSIIVSKRADELRAGDRLASIGMPGSYLIRRAEAIDGGITVVLERARTRGIER